MLLTKASKVLENKLSIGNHNSMKLKDNMPIFKVNLRKRKLFGKVNLNSLRNKRIKPRKIRKKGLSNFKLPSTNSKRLIPIANLRMSKIMEWLCNSLSKNSNEKRRSKKKDSLTKTNNSKRPSKDWKKKTKP